MQHNILPHGTMWIRITTPIGNMVQLKSIMHPLNQRKSRKPEQIKEKAIQGSISTTTSMMNSIRFTRNNAMRLLNGASPRIMAVKSLNMNNETQKIRSIPIIKQ